MTKYLPRLVRRSEVFREERKHLVPAVDSLLLPVPRPVVVEETMPSFRVHVKLVGLPVLLQLLLMLLNLLRSRKLILFTKESKQWTRQVLRIVYWCDRILSGQFLLRHNYSSAPALDGGIEALCSATDKDHFSSACAGADYSPLAVPLLEPFHVT